MAWARHPEVLHRSTSRGPVVLRPGATRPEHLAGVGAVVLELLAEPAEEAQLAAHLAEVGATAGDLGAVLLELERRGLAVRRP